MENINIITPSEGLNFRRKSDGTVFFGPVALGKLFFTKDGKRLAEPHTEVREDFEEVMEIKVVEESCYVLPTDSYDELVSELIRCKYTLDAEIAIAANCRIEGNGIEEEATYQKWRAVCKEAAKLHLNI